MEKAIRQLAILYWNAGNLLKSNIDQCRQDKVAQVIHGTYVENWVMNGMNIIAVMSRNRCMNPLITSCCGTSKFRLTTRLDTIDKPDIEVLDKIERQMSDY